MSVTALPETSAAKPATAFHQTKAIDADKLYPPKVAAELLNMSTSWLAKARGRGNGPRYVKLGRSVKYQGVDIIEYRKSKKRHSTSG
jgi:predicted DNA-binding transcriptional regulator AlpA